MTDGLIVCSSMRVAALYDIHRNLPAVRAVLAELAREDVKTIVVGGDVAVGPALSSGLLPLGEYLSYRALA